MQLAVAFDSWLERFWSAFVDKLIEEIKIGDIGEHINEGILQWKKYFNIGGHEFVITDAIIVMVIATIIMIVLFKFLTGKESVRPNKKQTMMWFLYDLLISTAMGFGMNRKEAEKVAPMVGTIAIIIGGCNVISTFKISPPAKNIAFPVAMALFAIVYVIYISIRFVGVKGFWASLTSPMKALLPFKVLDFFIKPVSLSLRLFGNVFGAFVFMEFLYIVIPIVVPGVFGLWFDIIDGMLQAVVFSYLTMSYIGEIVEVGHEAAEEGKKKEEAKKVIDDSAVAA